MSVGEDAPGPEETRVGLYHFAWEMDSFEDLKALYEHMKAKDVNIGGIGDHGVSLGVYLFDPDGNEIEVYHEMPQEDWVVSRRWRPVPRGVSGQAGRRAGRGVVSR